MAYSDRNVSSHDAGGEKSEVKRAAGSAPSGGSEGESAQASRQLLAATLACRYTTPPSAPLHATFSAARPSVSPPRLTRTPVVGFRTTLNQVGYHRGL